MGQLIEFRPPAARNRKSGLQQRHDKTDGETAGAKVLLFTGIRYERPASSPSERLKALSTSKQVQ